MLGRRKSETIGRGALVAAAILGLGRIAIAEPESVRIDYAAPTGCPDTAAFVRALRERTARFREAAPDAPVRRFLVQVKTTGASFKGRLEIQSPDGPTVVRNVEATVCSEVSSALALITALTIDPNALAGSSQRASKSRAEPGPESTAEPDGQRPPPSAKAVAALPPSEAAKPSQPWHWSSGLGAHTTFFVSPNVGYGGDIFVEAEAPITSRLGPAVRVGIFFNQSDVDLPTGAAARFQWALMELVGCPVRLGGMRLALHPCVAFRLGILHGEGRRISQPAKTVSPWADAGPVLRLRIAVATRLTVEAQASVLLPLHRPTFEIVDMGSPAAVYSVPRLGGSAGIGIAYRFR